MKKYTTKYLIIIFTSLLISLTNSSQTLINNFTIVGQMFFTDILGSIYSINNLQILKYNENGEKLCTYQNTYLGKITSIDVSDPLRILVFYKDFNQILFLDKNLTELSTPIRLDELLINQAEVACSSDKGGFWIYDKPIAQLIYFDKNRTITHKSHNLFFITKTEYPPVFMTEKNDYLYLSIPQLGILIFDLFGSYIKTIPLTNIYFFQASQNNLVFFENNKLIKYNHVLMTSDTIALPPLNLIQTALMEQKKIYLFSKNSCYIYSIK